MKKAIYRPIVIVLAFLMIFEPVFMPIVVADELPRPDLNTDEVDGIVPIDDLVAPSDYLHYMLSIRGRTKEEAEVRAWGEWTTMLMGAYMQMDAGASDVFSFYEALRALKDQRTFFKDTSDGVRVFTKYSSLAFAFLGKTNVGARAGNLLESFLKLGTMSKRAKKFIETSKTLKFMEFMSPPPCWSHPDIAGEGFKSYWRWVRKKTFNKSGQGLGRGRYISDAKGIARSIGIGLVVFSIAVDAYGILTSEDKRAGREWTYSLVKNYIGLGLGIATLVAMFCVPIVGQVAMIATGIWLAVVGIGDLLGMYNKKWNAAYKGSFNYLYETDPEFRSFYDNREALHDETKSVSLTLVEKNYSKFMAENSTNKSGDKEEDEVIKKNKKVYNTLEKQGVLVSYYGQKGFNLPDFSTKRLQELWEMKADYMTWKPSFEKSQKLKKAGFWGKLGHAVNPLTHISRLADKVQGKDYRKIIEEYNITKVFFNPDYVLLKKYQNYITANRLRGGIYDMVGLRIEQSPFNYIPLVDIDNAAWNEELMKEAFLADSFMIGAKELIYFREQIKHSTKKVKQFTEDLDDKIEKIDEVDLPHSQKIRKYLEQLVEAYKSSPGSEDKSLYKSGRKIFGWRWNKDWGKKSAENIIKVYKTDIEQSLMYEPLALGQKAADTVLLLANIKQQLDTAKMMRSLGEEKKEALSSFDDDFKNYSIRRYLKTGDFLNVERTVFDWLSGNYSTYDDMEKYVYLYFEDVNEYAGAADEANSSTRDRLLWFDKEVTHPKELIRKLNAEIEAYRMLVDKFGQIKDEAELEVTYIENTDFADKVFAEYELGYDLDPIDLDKPVAEVQIEEIIE